MPHLGFHKEKLHGRSAPLLVRKVTQELTRRRQLAVLWPLLSRVSMEAPGELWRTGPGGRANRRGRYFVCAILVAMATTFLYRCPTTGQTVQGWSAEEVTDDDGVDDTYQSFDVRRPARGCTLSI